MTDPLKDALRETLDGLYRLIPDDLDRSPFQINVNETTPEHLRWMVDQCWANLDDWPVDKTSRWIGYIQGVLAALSSTFSVSAERDRTRPFFHRAYALMDIDIPGTAG